MVAYIGFKSLLTYLLLHGAETLLSAYYLHIQNCKLQNVMLPDVAQPKGLHYFSWEVDLDSPNLWAETHYEPFQPQSKLFSEMNKHLQM